MNKTKFVPRIEWIQLYRVMEFWMRSLEVETTDIHALIHARKMNTLWNIIDQFSILNYFSIKFALHLISCWISVFHHVVLLYFDYYEALDPMNIISMFGLILLKSN